MRVSPRIFQNFKNLPGASVDLPSACLQYRPQAGKHNRSAKKLRQARKLQVYRADGGV
jgi:hypothetical protein